MCLPDVERTVWTRFTVVCRLYSADDWYMAPWGAACLQSWRIGCVVLGKRMCKVGHHGWQAVGREGAAWWLCCASKLNGDHFDVVVAVSRCALTRGLNCSQQPDMSSQLKGLSQQGFTHLLEQAPARTRCVVEHQGLAHTYSTTNAVNQFSNHKLCLQLARQPGRLVSCNVKLCMPFLWSCACQAHHGSLN